MKKIAILFILHLMLCVNIYCSYSTEVLSEPQLANVEALASGESGTSNTGPREKEKCYGGGHKWCVVALILIYVLIAIVFKLITVLVNIIQTKVSCSLTREYRKG